MNTSLAAPPVDPSTTDRQVGTLARQVAATAIVVGGLVHLQLYLDGYRDLPDANLGRSFLANVAASVLIGLALLARPHALVRLAGLGVTVGTLAAFAKSRTGAGVFGLRESGLQPAPQAAIALVAEVLALVLLALTFVPTLGGGRPLAAKLLAPVAGAVVAATVVLGVLWARNPERPAVAATPGTVAIAGFAFDPAQLTVPVGTTLTWTNADSFAHTVTSRDAGFDSGSLANGASFSHTFDAAGTFTYVCAIHPSMTATVVVDG
jgi:plastocyanin